MLIIQHLVFFDAKTKNEDDFEPEIYDGDREEQVINNTLYMLKQLQSYLYKLIKFKFKFFIIKYYTLSSLL